MDIEQVLSEDEQAIIEEASRAVAQLEHYRQEGAQVTRRRVEMLYRHLNTAVHARDLRELRAYVREIARERYEAGYQLSDVQAAFAALEESIWRDAETRLPRYDLAFGIGLVSTALAHGRDTLGRTFDAAAPRAVGPAPDLTPFFTGAERGLAPCPPEEMVYPV
jgi:hypothetical protein